jgi:hypothetical protein
MRSRIRSVLAFATGLLMVAALHEMVVNTAMV